MTDMLLVLSVAGAILLYLQHAQGASRWAGYGVFALLGMGMLVKGPIAVALFGLSVLVVEDDGPGIAEHDIPHVFTRFWRSDASRSLSGNGLGLALVKAIVTSYCGTVTCARVDPHGARFIVTLPTSNAPSTAVGYR